ncbi:leucine rich repeat containing 46-like [Planoprotostelium fungivorum]|uniref:Leucine rich repeat containing 46-like n=1 Tax=Planoprotostelium fungivorum TaxID=1890364 RepID=A0A2P6N1C9_9EUKA|nr:leucine rich repeat containing 46-like [Planoprotostelium fungivorum]
MSRPLTLESQLRIASDVILSQVELTEADQLRLDRQRLNSTSHKLLNTQGEIALPNVTSLYLQFNELDHLDGVLENFPRLRFLAAFNNNIKEFSNLKVLDLSHNQISAIPHGALPTSLLFVFFLGNPVSKQPNYRQNLIKALPAIAEIDGVRVQRHERLSAGYKAEDLLESDDSSAEEEEEQTNKEEGRLGDILEQLRIA